MGERFRDWPAEALVTVVARQPYVAKGNNARVVCGGGLVREGSVEGGVYRTGTCSVSCVFGKLLHYFGAYVLLK